MKYVTKRQRNRKKNNEIVYQRPDQTGTGDPEVPTKAENPEDPEHVSADEMDEEKDQATSLPVPFLGLEFTATRNPLKSKKFVVTRSLALQTTGGFRRQSSVPVHNFRNYSTTSSYIGTTTTTTTSTTTRCYSVQTIESAVAAKELMQHYCHHSNPLTLGNFMDLKGFQTANRNRRKAHSEVKDPPKSKIKKKSVESQPEEYSTPSTSSVTPSNSNSNSGSLLEEPAMDSTPGPSHHPVNGHDPPETTPIETLAIHDASLDIGPVVPIAGLDEAKRRAIRRDIGEAIGALVGGTILEIPSLEPGNTPFHLSFLDGWLHGTGICFAKPEDSDDEFEVDENAPLKPIGYEARMRRIKSGGPSPRERAAERSRITFGTVEWLGHSDAPQLSIADGVRRIIFRAPFNPDSNRDYPGHWLPSIWSVDEEVVRLCMGDDVSIWPEIHTNLIPPQQRKRYKALARQNASRHPDVVPRNHSSSFHPQQRHQQKKKIQKKPQHYPKQQLQHVSESQLQQVSESQLKHVSELQLKHFNQPEEQRPVQLQEQHMTHHQHQHQLEVDPHVQQQLQALWQQQIAQQHQQNNHWMPPNAPSLPNHQQQAFLQAANLPPDHFQAIMQQQHLQHMQAIYQQEQQQQLQHIQAIRQQEQQQQLQHMQANYLQEQQQQELHKLQEQHKQQQQQMLQQHQHQQQQLLQQQRQQQQQQQHLMQQQLNQHLQQPIINMQQQHPIHHQVQHPVQVQVQQQMHFPVPVPMQIPVQVPMQTPVQVPMQLPVQQPIQHPVQVPIQHPVQQPMQPPVLVPMQLPVQVPIQPPVQPPIQQPIQPPLEQPPENLPPPQSSQEEPQASSSQSQPNHPSPSRFHRKSDNFNGWKKWMDDACHAWNVEVFPDDLSQEILDGVRMYAIHGEKFFDMPMGKRYKATLEPIGPVATRPIGGRCSRLGQNRQALRSKLKFQHPKVKYTPSPYRLSGRMEIRPPGTRPRNTWYGHPNTFYTKAQVIRIRKYQKKKKSGAKANHSGEDGASGSGSGSGNNSGATGSSSESGENEETSPKEDFQLSKANFPPLPPPNQKRKD
ncbi:uncharacterized protein [Drosophila bipectinata]|uniref:uncharacterized protein n=1 Tax=Drosophila bipectinata TaxID=42026 RepID=UPI0038B2728A